MKKIAKRLFPDTIVKGINRKRIEYFGGGYFGLNGLDRKLEKYVDYDNGFYVELGANDGMTQSNSYYFELKRGWRGVLVEPSPHNYLACRELRGTKNSVHCNACVGFDYKEKFVEISYANLMSVSNGIELDLENVEKHLESAQRHLRVFEKAFIFGAVAKPLTRILDDSGAPALIDFLSLDVEGAEIEVLKGIDFEKYAFKFMLIECRDILRLERFLNQKNYKLVDKLSEHDFLFSPRV